MRFLALLGALLALLAPVRAVAGSDMSTTTTPGATRAEALFVVARGLTKPWGEKELEGDREERLRRVADAIVAGTDASIAAGEWDGDPVELDALSLTLAYYEGWRFSRKVHLGGARKDTTGQAISLWSLHAWRLVPYAEWKTLGGLEGTERSARAAARVIAWGRQFCKVKPKRWAEATIAIYATGRRCSWSGSFGRAKFFRRVLSDVRAEMAPSPLPSPSWAPLPADLVVTMR